MLITDIISSDQILCNVDVASKKRALELMSEVLCKAPASGETPLVPQRVFEALVNRERLGSTSIGNGVSIPHARCCEIPRMRGTFLRLKSPIDYDALDNKPVDLLFGLLVPESSTEDHLQLLSALAEMFSDPEVCSALRHCDQAEPMMQVIRNWVAANHSPTT